MKTLTTCLLCCLLLTATVRVATCRAERFYFVGSNFPILSEIQPDNSLGGIGVIIVRIICNRLGHTADIHFYPWARAQALIKAGQADVLIAPYKTPEREKWMDYTKTPFFEDCSFFFVRPDSDISWTGNLQELKALRIGMVPGWSVGPTFERETAHLNIDHAPTIDLCFQKLLAGRVDVVPTQLREATAAFNRLGIPEEKRPVTLRPVLANHFNYYGFSKKRRQELQHFKAEFERELEKMHDSGEIAQLLFSMKWGAGPPPSENCPAD